MASLLKVLGKVDSADGSYVRKAMKKAIDCADNRTGRSAPPAVRNPEPPRRVSRHLRCRAADSRRVSRCGSSQWLAAGTAESGAGADAQAR
jgi:hypothetical protein